MSQHPVSRRGPAALAVVLAAALGPAASAATAHTVVPGESFWSIAVANGVSPYTLAAANGRSLGSTILPGETLYVPAPAYGTTTTYGTTTSTGTTASTGVSSGASPAAYGMVPVSGPDGTAYLAPTAAQNLESLRAQSRSQLGVDVYPAGPLSGYRTYAQQAELYRLYLAGEGPLAAPPGESVHETGRALDLGSMSGRQAVDELGAPYGWEKIEAPSEWWHVNYVGP